MINFSTIINLSILLERKGTMSNESINSTEYGGHCAFAVSTGKTDVKGGKSSLQKNNKTYLFSNGIAKILFRLLPNRIQKADEIWNSK